MAAVEIQHNLENEEMEDAAEMNLFKSTLKEEQNNTRS